MNSEMEGYLAQLSDYPWDIRALEVLQKLQKASYEAYFVGGCVRDALLGRAFNDYDIASSAQPQDMAHVFPASQLVASGLKFGGSTVIHAGLSVEVTTYRSEGFYTDSRRPGAVQFISSIEEDLSRRDFSINALAYNPLSKEQELIDRHGGLSDLQARIIRAVGNPSERFNEDALRILRAQRLAAELEFKLESHTAVACEASAPQIMRLSAERITQELWRFLAAPKVQDLLEECPAVWRNTLSDLQTLSPTDYREQITGIDLLSASPRLRLLWLLRNTAWDSLASLRLSRRQTDEFKQLRLAIEDGVRSELSAKQALGRLGQNLFFELLTYLSLAEPEEQVFYKAIYQSAHEWLDRGLCLSIKELAIDGNDLLRMGFAAGPRMGQILVQLLSEVLLGQLENKAPALLARAQSLAPYS